MKKILASLFTFMLLISLCVIPASAEEVPDKRQIEELFLDYCRLHQYGKIPEGDSVTIDEIIEVDDVWLFTGRYSEDKIKNQPASMVVGDYRFYRDGYYSYLDLYAYYYNDRNPNAINKDGWQVSSAFDIQEIRNILAENIDVIDFEGISVVKQLYKEQVEKHLYEQFKEVDECLATADLYEEIFYYYDSTAQADDTEPEYVLFLVIQDAPEWEAPLPPSYSLGNYGVYPGHLRSTAPFYYGIYIPGEDKVYTVEEAYNAGIKGIESIFEVRSFPCGMIGDADGDKKITVKDATCIQKYFAGIEFETLNYNLQLYSERNDLRDVVFDFNRDHELNIKDATAIQKHIAGLAY